MDTHTIKAQPPTATTIAITTTTTTTTITTTTSKLGIAGFCINNIQHMLCVLSFTEGFD